MMVATKGCMQYTNYIEYYIMYTITNGKIYTINASQFSHKIIPVIIIIVSTSTIQFFSSFLLQPTIAKPQSKVKQYDFIF